jgi:hypothetical protein
MWSVLRIVLGERSRFCKSRQLLPPASSRQVMAFLQLITYLTVTLKRPPTMAEEVHTDHVQYDTLKPSDLRSLNFMSLPREVRDEIYTLTLFSPSPIIVWKGEWINELLDRDAEYTSYADFIARAEHIWRRVIDQSATKTSLDSLSTNMLFCTKVISQEAAEVFYKKNTFAFLGHHNWDPVVSWLEMIGGQNRNHLSNLEINAYKPDEVWQRHSGERVEHPDLGSREPIYPRNSHLHVRRRPFKYGLVDNINPALETIFRLLGQRESTQKLTLNFKLCGDYPGEGAIYQEGNQHPQNGWHSMDLPNLIEKFRTLYTLPPSDSSEPLVQVLWKGECRPLVWHRLDDVVSRIVILDHVKNIESHGWELEISPMKEDDSKWKPHDERRHVPTFVMRRKPLAEPLMGDDPNPHSGCFIQPGMEEFNMEGTTGYYL